MDVDQENQWWNPSSSLAGHIAQLVAEANPDEKSSIASKHRKKGGPKIINRRLYAVRYPNKKSTISSGKPETAHDLEALNLLGKVPPLDFSASIYPPAAESNAGDDIRNAARYFSCSSSSSGTKSEFPSEKPYVEKVSNNSSMMDLWGNYNVDSDCGNVGFVDEEAMFNMQGLVNSMAEGMLLTPPAMKSGFKWDDIEDDYIYLDLWENS